MKKATQNHDILYRIQPVCVSSVTCVRKKENLYLKKKITV